MMHGTASSLSSSAAATAAGRRRGGGFGAANALVILVVGTLLNVYVGWARDRTCALEVRLVSEELERERRLTQQKSAGAGDEDGHPRCPKCPACPVLPPNTNLNLRSDAGTKKNSEKHSVEEEGEDGSSSSSSAASSGGGGEGVDSSSTADLPCPPGCKAPHGSCGSGTGRCTCASGFSGKECTLSDAVKPADLVTVVLPSAKRGGGASASRWARSARRRWGMNGRRVPKVVAVSAEEEGEEEIEGVAWVGGRGLSTLGEELNALLAKVETELVMVAIDSSGVGDESDLDMVVRMFRETDVDVLGGLEELPTHQLTVPCYDIVHKRWQAHYRKPPFGYRRHEKLVMYCDTTSQTFVARTELLRGRLGGFATGPGFEGRACAADLFLRINHGNQALLHAARNDSAATPAARRVRRTPTRLPGWVLVGTGSEVIFPTSAALAETFSREFAEKHQIEAYFAQSTGKQVGAITCVKTGGSLQHAVDGRYSPLCHRYTRQRDFAHIYDLWTGPELHDAAAYPHMKLAVSLHHGNLFGALRLGEELLWEQDGDFDLVSFNYTGPELRAAGDRLVARLRSDGYHVEMPRHGLVTYLNVYRNKTDFQINLRSPRDSATAGKPPHRHKRFLMYSGRKVYMNGFANPWRGVRADKGHDYGDQYLQQQPWVQTHTSKAIGCKKGVYHNACLPQCNDAEWMQDHEYCSDDGLTAAGMRNPLLWERGREAEPVWHAQVDRYL